MIYHILTNYTRTMGVINRFFKQNLVQKNTREKRIKQQPNQYLFMDLRHGQPRKQTRKR